MAEETSADDVSSDEATPEANEASGDGDKSDAEPVKSVAVTDDTEQEVILDYALTLEGNPLNPLLNLDNVILTPHVSGLSIQALEDIAVGSVQNMVSVLSGHMPHSENVVNPDVVPRFRLDPHDAEVVQGISSS